MSRNLVGKLVKVEYGRWSGEVGRVVDQRGAGSSELFYVEIDDEIVRLERHSFVVKRRKNNVNISRSEVGFVGD